MNRALIIVAHGSSVNPETAETVSHHAAALAERPAIQQAFDAVEVRYLKQEPLVTKIDWSHDEVVVVPFFMSDGWFVRKILPKKLGVDPFEELPARSRRDECRVTITRPLGVHPALDGVVRELALARVDSTAHLVLVGHGTPRHPRSTNSVQDVVDRLAGEFASVSARFVDDEPELATTWDDPRHADGEVVVVPYFAFRGPHVTGDIPELLDLPDASVGPHDVAGRRVWYSEPVGEHATIVDVLEAIVDSPVRSQLQEAT